MKLQYEDINLYLQSSDIIDFDKDTGENIRNLGDEIWKRSENQLDYIKNAFEYIRDEIGHTRDIKGNIVTCKASDVLAARTGICFAKSHLLAALLRYKGVPTGFCYQKLILNSKTSPYLILHGLNGVYIEEINKWIRLDARGNKEGVNAQFSLDKEQIAFPINPEEGEEDIPIIFAVPDENVVRALTTYKTLEDLWANLPTGLYK
ncbi:transglutaminase-like domain-containing protein [Cellulosilyticum ruminicola]|uniref:transglutaminase-like domain-containing protein n=1 Tax=Cellulosilyticum ruminicola TaxID=425254 RepID=UPI0006D1B7D3|nr:transglutaminase-like domain-containing protein [Cellulosilyticum ruminicola]